MPYIMFSNGGSMLYIGRLIKKYGSTRYLLLDTMDNLLFTPKAINQLGDNKVVSFRNIAVVQEKPGVYRCLGKLELSHGYQTYKLLFSRNGWKLFEGLLVSAVIEDIVIYDDRLKVSVENLTEVILHG